MKFSVHCNCLSEKIVLTGRQLDSAVSSLGWSEDGLSFALGKLHTVHSLTNRIEDYIVYYIVYVLRSMYESSCAAAAALDKDIK